MFLTDNSCFLSEVMKVKLNLYWTGWVSKIVFSSMVKKNTLNRSNFKNLIQCKYSGNMVLQLEVLKQT